MFTKFLFNQWLLLSPDDDGKGGGGGAAPTKAEFDAIKASNEALMKRLDALEKGKKTKTDDEADDDEDDSNGDDESLADKARKTREQKDKETKSTAEMEKALKFNLAGADFMKTNASLLPQSVQGIFDQAEKENYATASEKASAIKVGIISEFFALDENMNHLTGPQKLKVEEFKKLHKTDKQERAGILWDEIFEPTFETLKKVKRAQQMSQGEKNQTDKEKALTEKWMKNSKKHYLGEKDA